MKTQIMAIGICVAIMTATIGMLPATNAQEQNGSEANTPLYLVRINEVLEKGTAIDVSYLGQNSNLENYVIVTKELVEQFGLTSDCKEVESNLPALLEAVEEILNDEGQIQTISDCDILDIPTLDKRCTNLMERVKDVLEGRDIATVDTYTCAGYGCFPTGYNCFPPTTDVEGCLPTLVTCGMTCPLVTLVQQCPGVGNLPTLQSACPTLSWTCAFDPQCLVTTKTGCLPTQYTGCIPTTVENCGGIETAVLSCNGGASCNLISCVTCAIAVVQITCLGGNTMCIGVAYTCSSEGSCQLTCYQYSCNNQTMDALKVASPYIQDTPIANDLPAYITKMYL
jgi:hypothetical protein